MSENKHIDTQGLNYLASILAKKSEIPTHTSQLINDSGFGGVATQDGLTLGHWKIKEDSNNKLNIQASENSNAILSLSNDNSNTTIASNVTLSGALTLGNNKDLLLTSGSDNDTGDIVWSYSDGKEQARLWIGGGALTTKKGPNFRVYKTDGTQLYSGNLVLTDGTGASGTWPISINGNAANVTGTIAVANGGTGKTSGIDAANYLLNSLTTGSSDPVGTDYYIAQYAGGGTTTTTYHRRPVSALYNYIKSAASGSWAISVTGSSASCTGNAASATIARSLGADESMKVYGQSSNEVNFGGTNNSTTIYMGYRAKDSKAIPTQFIFGGSTGSASIKAGSYIAGNHSSAVGSIVTGSGSTSLASAGWARLCSTTLTPGTWIAVGCSSTPSSSTGFRYLKLSGTDSYTDANIYNAVNVGAGGNSDYTKIQVARIFSITSSTTMYLWGFQNSGSRLTVDGYILAIRIV